MDFYLLKDDYENCKKQIKFWNRIKNDDRYLDLFSLSEIDDLIYYYTDMKKYLLKELRKII